MNQHKLGIPKSWLENLKTEGADKTIFMCGTSPIDHSESGISDKIIVLTIDEEAHPGR